MKKRKNFAEMGWKRMGINVDRDLYRKIKARAVLEDKTPSEIINEILEKYVNETS